MKKILTLTCALMLCFVSCFCFIGCKNNESTKGKILLTEATHSVFYAPLYVAINLGYMSDEGLDVEVTNGGGSDVCMTSLLSGAANVALMGPETVVYVEASGSTNHPTVFGQLTKKDGTFLISKTQYTNFDFSKDLNGKTAIVGRRGSMLSMTFEWLVNSKNVFNGKDVTLDMETSFPMMVSVFESTDAEFCTMFEPTASEFVASGKGYYVNSIGEESGEIPYTCFMAYPNYISQNKDNIEGFLRAIKKAYNYICSNPSSEVAKALKPSFDGTSLESLATAVEKYLEIDVWSSSPAMSKDSYNRLLSVLKNSKTLTEDVDFSKVVDNSIANTI